MDELERSQKEILEQSRQENVRQMWARVAAREASREECLRDDFA